MRKIVYLFLLLMIFTNAFAFNSVLTPSFAISFILIFHFLIHNKKRVKDYPPFLFFLWTILTFSYIVMSDGEKCTNHWFLWTFPFFSYYFVFKNELFELFSLEQIKKDILKYISYTTIFACLFCLFEFLCSNFIGFDLSFIPRGAVEEYYPFDGFYRARSFVEESGHFSFFLEIFGPLTIYWLNFYTKSKYKYIGFFIIILALFTTLSGVGFVCFFAYLISICYYYVLRKGVSVKTKIVVSLSLSLFLFFIIFVFSDIFDFVWGIIEFKLDSNNVSHADRVSRFDAVDKLSGFAYLIGYGPAAFSTLNTETFISLYLGILMNTGILGLVLFMLFSYKKYKKILRFSDDNCKFAFMSSFLFAIFHLTFIDIIYVPWFWVLLSLIDVIYLKEKYIKKINKIYDSPKNTLLLVRE